METCQHLVPSQLSLVRCLQGIYHSLCAEVFYLNGNVFKVLFSPFQIGDMQARGVIRVTSFFTTVMSATEIEEGIRLGLKNRLSCSSHGYTSQRLLSLLQDCSVFSTYAHKISPYRRLLALPCAVQHWPVRFFSFFFFPPVLQLVECLQPALCEECSRFRKITRGESLTHSSCCVTKGSYRFTTESRLGGTAAVFRSSQVEETRNCD